MPMTTLSFLPAACAVDGAKGRAARQSAVAASESLRIMMKLQCEPDDKARKKDSARGTKALQGRSIDGKLACRLTIWRIATPSCPSGVCPTDRRRQGARRHP